MAPIVAPVTAPVPTPNVMDFLVVEQLDDKSEVITISVIVIFDITFPPYEKIMKCALNQL
jgi:hypothetical protein